MSLAVILSGLLKLILNAGMLDFTLSRKMTQHWAKNEADGGKFRSRVVCWILHNHYWLNSG